MEDGKEENSTNETNQPLPVMDVTPPSSAATSDGNDMDMKTVADPDPTPAPDESTEPAVTSDHKKTDTTATSGAPSKSAKAPVGAIITAIAVALILAAISIFAYLKTKPATVAPGGTNDQATQASEEATPESVDEATQAIDDSLNQLDASQDFPENELTDEALEL